MKDEINSKADGQTIDKPDQVLDETSGEKQTVKFETYDRAMNTAAKYKTALEVANEKLSIYEKEEADKAEKLLVSQGNFEKRLELEQNKRVEVEEKFNSLSDRHFGAMKEAALRREIPKLVEDGDIDAIIRTNASTILLDDDGFPIKESVEEIANILKGKSYLFQSTAKANPSSDAPRSDGSRLTYDKWLTLPSNERKQRYMEMRQNDK